MNIPELSSWRDGILLKLLNVLAYALFLSSNIYATTTPGSAYRFRPRTYISPSVWAYSVWPLIFSMITAVVCYQFTPRGKSIIIDIIDWRFSLLTVLSAIFLYVWALHYYILTFIFALSISLAMFHVYDSLRKSRISGDELWVYLPFSVYHGWTTVVLVITAFEAFGVNTGTHIPGVFTKFFVFIGLFFLQSVSALFAFSPAQGDFGGSIVITWVLFAIYSSML
ncbi:hypothetical protein Clacol_000052 [Clathrus columnatus]|uniref:Uncharacterized protein n=1 Tax=Clathrus columnatus TaxID=1419009 RepID=A0AAV4ZWJ6_9AGAM|nr:hypothetical protein Clacol_000052 [Clathrus columnatus]